MKPSSTPKTRRRKPPHAVSTRPPTNPPTPIADCTVPSASSLLPVHARIMGAMRTMAMEKKKLLIVNVNWMPRRLLRRQI